MKFVSDSNSNRELFCHFWGIFTAYFSIILCEDRALEGVLLFEAAGSIQRNDNEVSKDKRYVYYKAGVRY